MGNARKGQCDMPTSTLGRCTRPARYEYVKHYELRVGESFERTDVVVAGYCAQHDRAGGRSRMLRPRPWEYDYKHDTAAGIDVR